MITLTKTPITSGELGTLWMTYETSSMMQRVIDYFIETTEEKGAQKILNTYYQDIENVIEDIENIFKNEQAVIPLGFPENEVNKHVPPLFDDLLHIMFLRAIVKINIGLNSIHLGGAIRKDIREFYKNSWKLNQKVYDMTTDYLLEKGVLARTPYVTMPKTVEFIENENYLKGFNPFTEKRALNTIEVGFLFQSLESNIVGMQLLTGFAQVAKEKEVREYFIKGKELAKKVISIHSDLFLQSDIQPPSTWAGRATDSTVSPFSDKIMMFCVNFMSNSALGLNGLGASFSLRNDLPGKLMNVSQDTFKYAKEGGQILVKHKWLEEPPQMEDRNQLTKSKK